MKFITKYIKEGFFGNLGIDTPGNIRRVFDDLNQLRKKYPSSFGFKNPDMETKYGFSLRYYDYYITLKYDTCQIIIHNGKNKTNRNDMIINMLDFPDLINKLSKSKVIGFSVYDRTTLTSNSYRVHRVRYGPDISIINFRCENSVGYYRIKYDRIRHIATEIE